MTENCNLVWLYFTGWLHLDKGTSDFATFECEIAHKLRFTQIRQKPPLGKWFCLNKDEASLVRRAIDKEPIILTSNKFFEPRWVSRTLMDEFYKKNTKINSRIEVLEMVHHLGGIVTARLLELHMHQKEDFCRAKLEELFEQGYLNKVNSCLKPGTSRGRDVNFYCLNLLDTDKDSSAFRSGILRCYALMHNLRRNKYKGYVHEVDAGIILYQDKTYLFVSDDEHKSPDENLEWFYHIKQNYSEHRLTIISLEKARLEIYKAQIKGLANVSLATLNESKSYREKLD